MITSLGRGYWSMRFVVNRHGPAVLFQRDFIGEGMEARVYCKGEMAYKVYHLFSEVNRLSLTDTISLQALQTERILLPKEPLYTLTGKFRGYTTLYIEDLGLDSFVSLSKKELTQEFSLLQEDCQVLGESNICIHDLLTRRPDIKNGIFHHGLYFIDPGRFCFDFSLTAEEAIRHNYQEVDTFLFHRVARQFCTVQLKSLAHFYDEFDDIVQSRDISLMDYMLNDMKEDTLQEYLVRKNNSNVKIKRK